MDYEELSKMYNNNDNYRYLMMKLSIKKSFPILLNYIKDIPEIDTVYNLFNEMKDGEDIIKCDRGNRIHYETIYNNSYSKDLAVLFTIKVLNNNITNNDKKHIYNTYRYIQSHPYIFGDRIRYHVKDCIFNRLNNKQKNREKKFILNIIDYDESDTESESENDNFVYNSDDYD